MKADITSIINFIKERAIKKKRRNLHGIIEPMLYFCLLYPGQKTPVYQTFPVSDLFENASTRRLIPDYIKFLWSQKRNELPEGTELVAVICMAEQYVFMHELPAEVDRTGIDTSKYPLPSKDPKRKEAISLIIGRPEGGSIYIMEFIIAGKNIVFNKAPFELETGEFGHNFGTNNIYPI